MPSKGKRSKAAKIRWTKLDPEPHSSIVDMEVCDSECAQEVHSEPVVSFSCSTQCQVQEHSDSVMGTSENHGMQEPCVPSEISVQASFHQGHHGYGRLRNKQCTCMALTFLAYHSELDDVRKGDLDQILKKGNSLYGSTIKQLKQRNVYQHQHLTMEEVPLRVNTGRYGLFDSHSRNKDGLPATGKGKAVMITFTHLSDMGARIYKLYELLLTDTRGPIDGLQYDFMPVSFHGARRLSDGLLSPPMQSDKPHNAKHVENKVTQMTKDATHTGFPASKHSPRSVDAKSSQGIWKDSKALFKLNAQR